MLARKPNPAFRHPALNSPDMLIGIINADLEVTVAAIACQLIVPPGGRQIGFRVTCGVVGGIVGEERVVGFEEGVEEVVLYRFVRIVVDD